MRYEILLNARATRDIREFGRYLTREASGTVAESYLRALDHELLGVIAIRPHAFAWFLETGAPYRAKLFRMARTTYWIVYTVDADRQCVEIVRFWSTAREPGTHGL